MQIPIDVQPEFQGSSMSLNIFRNGAREKVPIPFLPYVYSKTELNCHHSEYVERKLFGSLAPTMLYRCEFETTLPIAKLNLDRNRTLYESHIRYVERVAIDEPDFYRGFPSRDPRVLVLDVEEWTESGTPTGRYMIGMLTSDGEVIQTENPKDVPLIVGRHDLIVGYNIIKYDWPRVLKWAGEISTPFVMYDVAKSAFTDQTLSGIKSRGLKDVAKHYGQEVIEVDGRNLNSLKDEEIYRYNASDLRATKFLFDIYFPKLLGVAEYMGIPLSFLLEEIPSVVPNILQARGLRKLGIVSDGTNLERHPDFQSPVQGAHVEFRKAPGIYRNILYSDFRQLYPTIMQSLNLGPDTTRLVGKEERHGFSVQRSDGIATYHIPDENYQACFIVQVDERTPSFIREFLEDIGRKRDQIKAKKKEFTEEEWLRSPYHGQENAYKVMRNTLYGYQLSQHARFGDIATGLVVTGCGREIIRAVASVINPIEVDTDGIFSSTTEVEEAKRRIEAMCNGVTKEWFGKNDFVIEYQTYPIAYFHAAKNYVLRTDNGSYILKGGGFKGRHRSGVEDKVLMEALDAKFTGRELSIKSLFDWSRYEPKDFLLRVALGRDLSEFKVETVGKRIAEQYLRHGRPVELGTIMEYYFGPGGKPRAYLSEEPMQIDYAKYREIIERLLERLGFSLTKSIEDYPALPPRICSRCHGMKWVLPAGKLMTEACPSCNGVGAI